jgi:hypothetical protein
MGAPTLSPYFALSSRAAASRFGTAIETWLSPLIMRKPLDHFLSPQVGDGLVIEAKLAG